ncbi:regulatory protein RecX [Microbacterium yannicii]|uniref:regulatory protein RecX n=1 Tax=Microbacterium yannicii TaxID=671622 RepID=UPI0020921579|nr:regulatory protein RecX [Microbacterium yannicii]MCO5953102.1 RecX family transcriptional regulator [Microbacterium yannicii]
MTPLFGGGARAFPKTAAEVQQVLEDRLPSGAFDSPAAIPVTAAEGDPGSGVDPEPPELGDAPRGDASSATDAATPIDLAAERADRSRSGGRSTSRRPLDDDDAAATAERGLVKKLRGRQLSVSEAKTYLGQYDLDREAVDAILDAFLERGYLDDARLAEQVVHAGIDRKGQGRQVIAQSLAKRGVPRDVADAALTELPDDDAERALEFARSKAGSLRGLERDVALRRLAGQLARRGYGGSMAFTAARTALEETTRPSGRVRFEDS